MLYTCMCECVSERNVKCNTLICVYVEYDCTNGICIVVKRKKNLICISNGCIRATAFEFQPLTQFTHDRYVDVNVVHRHHRRMSIVYTHSHTYFAI